MPGHLSGNLADWSVLQMLGYLAPRIVFAVICGGLIGLERELKNKAAGIKTNILICLGSTLFTALSLVISVSYPEAGHAGDPSRIAAQIVSGIGFLGVGTIIQSRGTVLGLTTAATIWVVAAIGLFLGLGLYFAGVICTVAVILVLVGTNFFEGKVLARAHVYSCEVIVHDPDSTVRGKVQAAMALQDLGLDEFNLSVDREGHNVLSLRYSGQKAQHKKFMLELWAIPGILEVRHQ